MFLTGVLKGIQVTIENLFKRALTIRYPHQKIEAAERFRGEHSFDISKCKSCGLCERICPSRAIEMIEIKGKKYPKIDMGKCSFCGLCTEICPFGALKLTKNFSLASGNKKDFIKKPRKLKK